MCAYTQPFNNEMSPLIFAVEKCKSEKNPLHRIKLFSKSYRKDTKKNVGGVIYSFEA